LITFAKRKDIKRLAFIEFPKKELVCNKTNMQELPFIGKTNLKT